MSCRVMSPGRNEVQETFSAVKEVIGKLGIGFTSPEMCEERNDFFKSGKKFVHRFKKVVFSVHTKNVHQILIPDLKKSFLSFYISEDVNDFVT